VNRALSVCVALGCVACGTATIDRAKTQAVDRAGQLLRQDVSATGGMGSPRFPELLQQFHAEITALHGRTHGRNEANVLKAYAAANDSYRYFFRFQALERDAVGGMVLLSGPNRPIASRYGLAIENRGGGRWVNRKTAMSMFIERADAELTNATRLVNGTTPK
jgi:hypothetical protein